MFSFFGTIRKHTYTRAYDDAQSKHSLFYTSVQLEKHKARQLLTSSVIRLYLQKEKKNKTSIMYSMSPMKTTICNSLNFCFQYYLTLAQTNSSSAFSLLSSMDWNGETCYFIVFKTLSRDFGVCKYSFLFKLYKLMNKPSREATYLVWQLRCLQCKQIRFILKNR